MMRLDLKPLTYDYVLHLLRERLLTTDHLGYSSSMNQHFTNDSFPKNGVAEKLGITDGEKILYVAHCGGEWLLRLRRDLSSSSIVAVDYDRRMSSAVQLKMKNPKLLALSATYEHLYNPFGVEPICESIESLYAKPSTFEPSTVDRLVAEAQQYPSPGFNEITQDWSNATCESLSKNLELLIADAKQLPFPRNLFNASVTYESARDQFDNQLSMPYLEMLRTSNRLIIIQEPYFDGGFSKATTDGFFERSCSILGSGGGGIFSRVREMFDDLCDAYNLQRQDLRFWHPVYYGHYRKDPSIDRFYVTVLRKSPTTRNKVEQDLRFIRWLLSTEGHTEFDHGSTSKRVCEDYPESGAMESLERLRILTRYWRKQSNHFYDTNFDTVIPPS